MLRSLSIRNYALIDTVDLEFDNGLTIVTGETGAGKSIMLGALSLLLGGRADTRVIGDAKARSEVQALFLTGDESLRPMLEEKGIEWVALPDGNAEILIRREIAASGRSRVFINDTLVTLRTLEQITPRLIDIHSQHANASINDPAKRLEIIDAFADNADLRADFAKRFADYVAVRRRLAAARESLKRATENEEFLRFRVESLDKLKPRAGELAAIEKRFETLCDADEIKEKLSRFSYIINGGDSAALPLLSEARSIVDVMDIPEVASRLDAVILELKDIAETVEDYNAGIDTDPSTLARLSTRMNLYYELMKRFRVDDADRLAEIHNEVKTQLQGLELAGDEIPALEEESRNLARALKHAAELLTESRRMAAENFSALIENAARPLGLKNLTFVTTLTPTKVKQNGADEVEFLCSFNKNGTPQPIAKVASGGEISRMMLCLKGELAGKMQLPTIIFDEVDTGVSGEIADKMGEMMHDMGDRMQVMAITHLPQVAAKGNSHFKVFKHDEENHTVTRVRLLDSKERIDEIAAMISGSEVTDTARMAAKELLDKSLNKR